ncbi:MAG: hypothetical protein EBQ60_00865, partial [Actinobacteria bacterium]|nr:hypothetical protein [Actinomycetota bacterium]
ALTIPEDIRINGLGFVESTANGALRQISGALATTLTGGITSSSAARINNDATTSITISTTQITNSNLITFGISTTGDINIPITINGAGGITKDGAGTGNLILSANNGSSYTGITTVSAGFLKVSNASALGSSVSGNTVVSGGTILIDSNNYTIAEPFNITGTGLSSNGAIRNLGKQTILSGAITLGGAATITSYGYNPFLNTVLDSLIITGGITLGSNALTLDVTRGMRIGDQNVAGSKITGTGAVIKSGGTDTLVMNVANDYSGITTVNNGVIVLKTATSLGTGVNGTTDHTSIAAGAAVKVDVSSATIQEYFSLNGTGINATGNIRVPSTSAGNTLSGTITIVTSGARINSDATLLTLSNATSIATGTNMSVALGGIGAITISGSLSGSGTITKDGTGAASILTLKGNSTGFTGPITVAANSNILKVSPTVNTNTSVLGTTGIVTINSGSAMQIEGGVALVSKPITVFGTGINNDGVIRSLSGANEIAGAITVSSNARINVDAGSLKLSNASALALGAFTLNIGGVGDAWVSGVITGTGAITKDGGSSTTLTLSGASSSYSGPIAVGSSGTPAAGILKVITNGSASGTGALTVYSGSALHIGDGTAVTLSNNMTVYGTGISGAGVIRNLLGSNILSGLTTFAATSRINSDGGTLTFNNVTKAIELVTYGVTFGGVGNITVSGILASTASSATATLDKDGSGVLTLSGANTYYGVTTVNTGVVNIQNNTALGNTATNTVVVNGAALEVQGALTAVAEPITLNGVGVSGVSGGGLRNISGNNVFTGLITLGANTRINSDLNILSFTNATKAIELSANTLNIGGASGDIVLSGPINGSGDITKDGGAATTLT